MNIENPVAVSPELAALASSDSATVSAGDPTVQACPYARANAEAAAKAALKTPLRVLMWNILELGGGFYQPAVRPDYAIEAYATVIKAMKADVCVVLGITGTVGATPAPAERGADDPPNHIMNAAVADTGPAEALRILDKLKSLDAAGSWEAHFLKPQGKTTYVYHENATTCFFVRTAAPLTFTKLDVIDCDVDPELGLTGKFVCATLQADTYKTGPLTIVAPLGVLNPRRPAPTAEQIGQIPALTSTATFPESALVALSAPGDLLADRSKFTTFKLDVDAVYALPATEGTLLRDDFWKTTSETGDDHLDNFSILGLDDLVTQDENLHWSAMDEPTHAATLPEVMGVVADALLVSHAAPTGKPRVDEMRVIDLVKAALTADGIAALATAADPPTDPAAPSDTAAPAASPASAAPAPASAPSDGPPPPKEDSVLNAQLVASRDSGSAERPAHPVNDLAECRYFSHSLSTHWPVIAQLRWT